MSKDNQSGGIEMAYSPADNINIFLSYASEDQAIADALAVMLRKAFFETFDITMMSEFPVGLNWRKLIDDATSTTDIMIAIASGRLKPGHSFTGYEVGSFSASTKFRPNMEIAPSMTRRMIPFAVLDRIPDTVNDFEGVDIDPKTLHSVRFDAANTLQEIENLADGEGNEATEGIVKFLSDIQDLINEALPRKNTNLIRSKERLEFFGSLSVTLCRQVFAHISNREKTVIIPKSKLIIRVPASARSLDEGLDEALVQAQGDCLDSFGVPEHERFVTWSAFLKLASSGDIAYSWNEAFRSLLGSLNASGFVENNTILSFNRKKAFRVFVARLTTLYSGVREYHVYVIPLLKAKDYGDPTTTTLLRALQISLGYRFLFLENTSEFSPNIFRATRVTEFRARVLAMMNALNTLLQLADDSGLNQPDVAVSILEVDEVEKAYDLWDAEKEALYDIAHKTLSADVDKDIKAAFIKQLTSFSDHTRTMNQRYTARVMEELQAHIAVANA